MGSKPQTDDGHDFKINDPEEISQKKRVNELLARRKAVIDARDEAHDAQLLGGANRQQALSYYRSRIESLIIDLWTKFKAEDIEKGEEFLNDAIIDRIEVPPPEELRPEAGADLGPGETAPEPEIVPIEGLKWFIEQNGEIEVEFSARLFDPPGEKTAHQRMEIPLSTLDQALLKCIEFMDATGIDADLTQEEQQTYITRELLEEVEEWRQQNIEE